MAKMTEAERDALPVGTVYYAIYYYSSYECKGGEMVGRFRTISAAYKAAIIYSRKELGGSLCGLELRHYIVVDKPSTKHKGRLVGKCLEIEVLEALR